MPAALRGGSQTKAKPRAKAPPSQKRQTRPAQAKRGAAARPQPLHTGGVSPKLALLGAAGLMVLALSVTLGTGHRGARLVGAIEAGVDHKFAQAGFRLKAVHVQGASAMATADIVRAAGVAKDQPLMGLDLDALRQRVEHVGWVKEARVVRLLPDTLVLSVVERKQLGVWQHAGQTVVIDDQGQVIPEADPSRFPGLPLVVGEGGATAAPAILPLLAQRPRLMERVDAIVRVDDRRWDLRLKDGSLIQLPATGEEAALMQLEQLDQRSHLLELGFERVDLRNPDTVAVRPRQSTTSNALVAGGV
jgi:cell division protein FtsQ